VLTLASAEIVGVEIDAENCRPTGRSYPAMGQQYRERYAEQFPGKAEAHRLARERAQ
jgi:hypothetical protein